MLRKMMIITCFIFRCFWCDQSHKMLQTRTPKWKQSFSHLPCLKFIHSTWMLLSPLWCSSLSFSFCVELNFIEATSCRWIMTKWKYITKTFGHHLTKGLSTFYCCNFAIMMSIISESSQCNYFVWIFFYTQTAQLKWRNGKRFAWKMIMFEPQDQTGWVFYSVINDASSIFRVNIRWLFT